MRSDRGFTLIEMLLATLLTAVLMVGVLAVIARVAEPIAAPVPGPSLATDARDADALVRLLQDDLSQALTLDTDGEANGWSFMSYGGFDALTNERTHRPTRIAYRVASIGERSWLVRDQTTLDGEAAMAPRCELVAADVSMVSLEPPDDAAILLAANRAAARSGQADLTDDDLPAEGRWRLRLWLGDEDEASIDRPVLLRRSLMR
ncbi:MAG: prepilin-type N-terminal cleavage/methylation domain-containing protein [Phycisphaeraceae bacterium]